MKKFKLQKLYELLSALIDLNPRMDFLMEDFVRVQRPQTCGSQKPDELLLSALDDLNQKKDFLVEDYVHVQQPQTCGPQKPDELLPTLDDLNPKMDPPLECCVHGQRLQTYDQSAIDSPAFRDPKYSDHWAVDLFIKLTRTLTFWVRS